MVTDVIECPKCGKNTLVKRHADLYQCVSCDFERDFSENDHTQEEDEADRETSEGGILPLLVLVVLVFAFL